MHRLTIFLFSFYYLAIFFTIAQEFCARVIFFPLCILSSADGSMFQCSRFISYLCLSHIQPNAEIFFITRVCLVDSVSDHKMKKKMEEKFYRRSAIVVMEWQHMHKKWPNRILSRIVFFLFLFFFVFIFILVIFHFSSFICNRHKLILRPHWTKMFASIWERR